MGRVKKNVIFFILTSFIIFSSLLIACTDTVKPVKDNTLIHLLLTRGYEDGGYTVVSPVTGLPFFYDFDKPGKIEQYKDNIKDNFKQYGYDLDYLVEMLFERNKSPSRLTLDSSPEDGYIIDSDGRFAYYFNTDNPEWQRGWQRLREDNPGVQGITTISLPAYDPKTSIVIAYTGWQRDWIWGEGNIIVFEYENGKLREICRLMSWIS